jgi:hypothetical protein
MYLLNLSLVQFLAVFGAISAVSVALYLLDRSRRRQVVSSLRFWTASARPAVVARRRRIHQPWSLLLQLAGMALLLLALAQLRWGSPAQAGRDHILILDTSAWMAARAGDRSLMDRARERARRYLRALPARDRVMLVRADALATPATVLEPDHSLVDAAIAASRPGYTALNLDQALAFARRVQAQQGADPGEIVFVGSGRTGEREPGAAAPPRNLRVLRVADSIENCGLSKIAARRSAADPSIWQIYVSAYNYGAEPRDVTVAIEFGPRAGPRAPAGSRRLSLEPDAETEATFEYRSQGEGVLSVALTPGDAFPADDRAELDLPAEPVLPVVVYSTRPEALRPALAATPRVAAVYRRPEEYRAGDQGLVILDQFIPAERPSADSIWIDPPAAGSPIPIRQVVARAPLIRWQAGSPITAGLHARDLKLERASVFETAPGDQPVGETAEGPVIVARPGAPKMVVFGFHPALSGMRYELAAPLLFANLLRWMSPEVFRRSEIAAGSVGTVRLALEPGDAADSVRATGQDGAPLPFTVGERGVEFFAGSPGTARVAVGDREYVYSLRLPQVGATRWQTPAGAAQGIPSFPVVLAAPSELWPWLALAGALALVAEWVLYGRARRDARYAGPMVLRRPAARVAEARR